MTTLVSNLLIILYMICTNKTTLLSSNLTSTQHKTTTTVNVIFKKFLAAVMSEHRNTTTSRKCRWDPWCLNVGRMNTGGADEHRRSRFSLLYNRCFFPDVSGSLSSSVSRPSPLRKLYASLFELIQPWLQGWFNLIICKCCCIYISIGSGVTLNCSVPELHFNICSVLQLLEARPGLPWRGNMWRVGHDS